MRKSMFGLALLAMTMSVFADWVADNTVEDAAARWLSSDHVARITMKGLSVAHIVHRKALRIVHLSPSGYVVMSGSDAADPVISFSRNDFVEPNESSPFYAMLEHSGKDVEQRENRGGERTPRWTVLVGSRNGGRALPAARLLEPYIQQRRRG